MQTTCTCANCGTTFEYERKGKPRKYCSRRCASSYQGRFMRDKASERQRQVKLREEDPARALLYRLRASAKQQGQTCTVTKEWLEAKLSRALCEMTGLPLSSKPYKRGEMGKRSFYAPSVDRIDNSQGYTQSNVRLVAWGYNLSKNSFTDREVMALSVATVLSAVPRKYRAELLELLPQHMLSALPPGNAFVDVHGRAIQE